MAGATSLRRAFLHFRTTANIADAEISCFSNRKFSGETCTAAASITAASTSEAVKGRLGESNEKKDKWLTLPPFNSSLGPSSLGKKILGRGRGTRNTAADDGNDNSTTVLKWVLRCCPQLPRSLVQKLFRLRQVRKECPNSIDHSVDPQAQQFRLKRVAAMDSMNRGERIFLPISVQQQLPARKQECDYSEEELNYIRSLELYKDPAIIAINKPPGLPVQGGSGIKNSIDQMAAMCFRHDLSDFPRLVHRLDRDCSGILVMGRTKASAAVLHSVFREKTFGASDDDIDVRKRILQKRYLALVIGVPTSLKGSISAPLVKVVVDDGRSERITITNTAALSQNAVTEYRVLQVAHVYMLPHRRAHSLSPKKGGSGPHGYASFCWSRTIKRCLTWLELSPLTGRKHQLRVHCAEVLGTPILGDFKYGWQAHRDWRTLPTAEMSLDLELHKRKMPDSGRCLGLGSISDKQPQLHLHCKQMILPNISLALEHASIGSNFDFSQLESISLVAPLPLHMQKSWDILNSLVKQGSCSNYS